MKGQDENKPIDSRIEGESKGRSVPPLPPLVNLAVQAGFELAALDEVPIDPRKLLDLVAFVSNDIICLFESRLTREDRALFLLGEAKSGQKWTDPRRDKIWGIYDQTVIEKAQTLGWRIYLSPRVLNRMAEWHHSGDHGIHRLQQLGEAVTRAARVAQGKDKLPITEPEWKEFKRQGVNELRRLLKQFRTNFNQRRAAPSYQEACYWIKQTVQDSKGEFPLWKLNIASLCRFLDLMKGRNPTLARRFVLGEIAPASLFDEWGSFTRNLSPETFRQGISTLSTPKL